MSGRCQFTSDETGATHQEIIDDLQESYNDLGKSLVAAVRRLTRIAEIIEAVDQRCAAVDGPVTPTLQEMGVAEIREIYRLARGEKDKEASRKGAL